MFLRLAAMLCLVVCGAFGQSTISTWFPILGDGEPWIETSKAMKASIVAVVNKTDRLSGELLMITGWNHDNIDITVRAQHHE
jgi:hypothetical protein